MCPFPPQATSRRRSPLIRGFQRWLGIPDPVGRGDGFGQDLHTINVIAQIGRPALVMAPNKTLAGAALCGVQGVLSGNAVEYFVSYYDYYQPEAYVPSRDLFIEKDSSINEHIEQMRLSATKTLLEREDAIIVATVSCIYGIGDPSDYYPCACCSGPATMSRCTTCRGN